MQPPVKFHSEQKPGPVWAAAFEEQWPAYEAWFLREGDARRPSYLECERALRTHMPELLDLWKSLVELVGGGDRVARFLSMYRPPPYLSGCSQAVFGEGSASLLVRNYDYLPHLWEARVWRTRWNQRAVLGMSDCIWGLLDGVNDRGLAVSLAFGGRRAVGDGFGIPLILRYVLQVCDTVPAAVEALQRIPCHMAYNVSLVDADGTFETVYLSPDRPARTTFRRIATNHQGSIDWPAHATATGSVARLRVLASHVDSPGESAARFVRRFLEPPVYTPAVPGSWSTLYTAVYRPAPRSLVLLWPHATVSYLL